MNDYKDDQELIEKVKNLAEEYGHNYDGDAKKWGNLDIAPNTCFGSNFMEDLYEIGVAPADIFDDGVMFVRPFSTETKEVKQTITEEKEVMRLEF